jgi:predicted CoA-substrate-specific enzyme activase
MIERFIGIDIGAETIKAVELQRRGAELSWSRHEVVEHHKEPRERLLEMLADWRWHEVGAAAVTGRMSRQVSLPRVPSKQALWRGFALLQQSGDRGRVAANSIPGDEPTDETATVVSVGSHGFSVLELRAGGAKTYRENSRCSQGTGNFLRQLVERFDIEFEYAAQLVSGIADPVPLSSRCPVILKTDITHLANKGEARERILAGLFDAVCENVQVLIKPGSSPRRVVLAGGVSRIPRIRAHFERFLQRNGMMLEPYSEPFAVFGEALGCAVEAMQMARTSAARFGEEAAVPPLEDLWVARGDEKLETVPPLGDFRTLVKRRPPVPVALSELPRRAVLGLDIGSTGSKAFLMDVQSSDPLWEDYTNTRGDPVGAARTLLAGLCDSPAARHQVVAVGVTGSGRDIVGSLFSVCYGPEMVFVFNEIAAHAEGALHYDARVDTIFEIGGQDAKYIRLEGGRVVDAAMNEACSAGTGSFIEEQGQRFQGVEDVTQLAREALQASRCVSLGQHCSVFMAEVIDQAVASGLPQRQIIAGIYDSIIQNYLNRVKGNRSVGQVIFCQGMPFASEALAAAVARQTRSEVVIPPNPGTVGALGIALMARREIDFERRAPIDLGRFLQARVESRDTFICGSNQGCGGTGNRCRIERLTTLVEGKRLRFTWGGSCSLHDSGTQIRKLPDRAPDPFREHQELMAALRRRLEEERGGGKRVALTDEFLLKDLFPFFATFLHELGYDVDVFTGADQATLKLGTERSAVSYCAPMKLYHGLVSRMADSEPDFLFLPMLRSLPGLQYESNSVLCPIVQASADLLRCDLGPGLQSTIISPVIDAGPGGLRSAIFQQGCRALARDLGSDDEGWRSAYEKALSAQEDFGRRRMEIGRKALAFCKHNDLAPVVVLGRPYTIYNKVLNSNVPAILRQQGAIAIPVDCYPMETDTPVFNDVYWFHGQRNLRAAQQIRRTEGVYCVWCSNYACGPDSFLLHFAAHLMEHKPFTVIETDGHSGDAGTKTRIEAFLYCARQDRLAKRARPRPGSLKALEWDNRALFQVRDRGEHLLIPRMGWGSEALAACLRGQRIKAEVLPLPDREALRLGQRYTSGKECLPIAITLGTLLQRLERDRYNREPFAFFMPTSSGPCRFGVYSVLHKLVLERLGWRSRVRVVAPSDNAYFAGIPAGFSILVFTGFMAADLLDKSFQQVRPVETRPGAAENVFRQYRQELFGLLQKHSETLDLPRALLEVASGRLFGVTALLERSARRFASVRSERRVPTVLVTGEIYNRLDPFANDFLAEKLADRGIRVQIAPFTEWIEYTDCINIRKGGIAALGDRVSGSVRKRIQDRLFRAAGKSLGWPPRIPVERMLEAAAPYLRDQLEGEAVLTVGSSLCEYGEGHVEGAIITSPLECMPSKIAEAQLLHLAEEKGLPSLTLTLNGDPLDTETLDTFTFEILSRFQQRSRTTKRQPAKRKDRPPVDRRPARAFRHNGVSTRN